MAPFPCPLLPFLFTVSLSSSAQIFLINLHTWVCLCLVLISAGHFSCRTGWDRNFYLQPGISSLDLWCKPLWHPQPPCMKTNNTWMTNSAILGCGPLGAQLQQPLCAEPRERFPEQLLSRAGKCPFSILSFRMYLDFHKLESWMGETLPLKPFPTVPAQSRRLS